MRYRVEVDHTTTYQVTVEASSVEAAIEAAQRHVYPNGRIDYQTLGHRTVATDAIEIEQVPA